MRYIPAVAAALLASGALAADKGKVATLDDLIEKRSPNHTACYVETSVSGVFLRNDRQLQGGAGVGCDAKLYQMLIGGGIRADWADWRDTGSIYAKLGMYLNNGAAIYGLAEWKVPAWKVRDAGSLALGAGAELKLEIINPGLWLFTESTVDATKFGSAATKDDVTSRLGLRLKF